MFHVQFMVDDKKFGEVMASLANRVMNLEFKHVVNTKVSNGAVVQEHAGGSMRDVLLPALIKDSPQIAKGARFNTDAIKAKIEELGGSRNSSNSLVDVLIKRKLMKRVGRGTFVVRS